MKKKGRVEGDATEAKEHQGFATDYQTLHKGQGTNSLTVLEGTNVADSLIF